MIALVGTVRRKTDEIVQDFGPNMNDPPKDRRKCMLGMRIDGDTLSLYSTFVDIEVTPAQYAEAAIGQAFTIRLEPL